MTAISYGRPAGSTLELASRSFSSTEFTVMATSTLVTHCGAHEVSREELDSIEAPPATDTWYPLKHAVVADTVATALTQGGFQIKGAKYAVSRNGMRLF